MQKLHQHRKHLGSIRLSLAGSRQETPPVAASGLEKQQGGEALLAPPGRSRLVFFHYVELILNLIGGRVSPAQEEKKVASKKG